MASYVHMLLVQISLPTCFQRLALFACTIFNSTVQCMDYANLASLPLDKCPVDLYWSGWTYHNEMGFEVPLKYSTTVRSIQQLIVFVKAQ